MIQPARTPSPQYGLADTFPALSVGGLLVLGGALLQQPETLAGDPLAHLLLLLTGAALILHRVRIGAAQDLQGQWIAVALAALAIPLAIVSPLAGVLRPVAINLAFALLALSLATGLLGRRMAGLLAVPVLVIYVLVPALPLFEAALSYPMRRLSAILAAGVLSVGPQPVVLNGTELSWGSLHVSVTSACSGLTLLQNLIWVAWWTVLLRHRGFLRRLAHASLVVPAVIIANTLRVIALALLANHYGEGFLTGPGHVAVGWVAVVLAGALFLGLEGLFPASAEADDGAAPVDPATTPAPPG